MTVSVAQQSSFTLDSYRRKFPLISAANQSKHSEIFLSHKPENIGQNTLYFKPTLISSSIQRIQEEQELLFEQIYKGKIVHISLCTKFFSSL